MEGSSETWLSSYIPGCIPVFNAVIQDSLLENSRESESCVSFDMCFPCPYCILLDSEDSDNQEIGDLDFHKNGHNQDICVLFK